VSLNLWAILGIIVVTLGGIGTAVVVINNRAYDRGVSATEKAATEALNRMEARLRVALKKNEALSDPELDCALKRLRQPNAPCE
jgi:hypothetical protein